MHAASRAARRAAGRSYVPRARAHTCHQLASALNPGSDIASDDPAAINDSAKMASILAHGGRAI